MANNFQTNYQNLWSENVQEMSTPPIANMTADQPSQPGVEKQSSGPRTAKRTGSSRPLFNSSRSQMASPTGIERNPTDTQASKKRRVDGSSMPSPRIQDPVLGPLNTSSRASPSTPIAQRAVEPESPKNNEKAVPSNVAGGAIEDSQNSANTSRPHTVPPVATPPKPSRQTTPAHPQTITAKIWYWSQEDEPKLEYFHDSKLKYESMDAFYGSISNELGQRQNTDRFQFTFKEKYLGDRFKSVIVEKAKPESLLDLEDVIDMVKEQKLLGKCGPRRLAIELSLM